MAQQVDADQSGWRFAQCFGDKTESNEDITEVSAISSLTLDF